MTCYISKQARYLDFVIYLCLIKCRVFDIAYLRYIEKTVMKMQYFTTFEPEASSRGLKVTQSGLSSRRNSVTHFTTTSDPRV